MLGRWAVVLVAVVLAGGVGPGCLGGRTETGPDVPEDAGNTDSGPTDPGPADPGPADPGSTDVGPTDPGPLDPGVEDQGPADPGPLDPGVEDQGPADPGSADFGPADPGPGDPGGDVPPPPLDPAVFTIRVPQDRAVGGTTAWDIDYVCRLETDGSPFLVYVQTNATHIGGMGDPTTYGVVGAWSSAGGPAQVLPGVAYDYGGNHHNDAILVPWKGQFLKVYHSSFGFGWRACQPPDCIQVLGADAVTVVTNGCGPDRSLPVICVQVATDGTLAPLVDTFQKCPGDPNA